MLIVAFICFIALIAAWLAAPKEAPHAAAPVAAKGSEIAAHAAS